MRPLAFLCLAVPGLVGCEHAEAPPSCRGLSASDVRAIHALVDAYRTSWLKGDARAVLGTFSADAALLPAHGAAPIVGIAAIENYWWPAGGPPSTITKLDITIDQLEGDCNVAYSHGRDDVAWTMDQDGRTQAYGHPGTYLNVYRKLPSGAWRISRHMWDDGPVTK